MNSNRKLKITNPDLKSLIRLLRKQSRANEAAIWRDAAENLSRSKRKRVAVNLSKINRYTQEKDKVLVPGKVLGAGIIDHPVRIAALDFSEKARFKIVNSQYYGFDPLIQNLLTPIFALLPTQVGKINTMMRNLLEPANVICSIETELDN